MAYDSETNALATDVKLSEDGYINERFETTNEVDRAAPFTSKTTLNYAEISKEPLCVLERRLNSVQLSYMRLPGY